LNSKNAHSCGWEAGEVATLTEEGAGDPDYVEGRIATNIVD